MIKYASEIPAYTGKPTPPEELARMHAEWLEWMAASTQAEKDQRAREFQTMLDYA